MQFNEQKHPKATKMIPWSAPKSILETGEGPGPSRGGRVKARKAVFGCDLDDFGNILGPAGR